MAVPAVAGDLIVGIYRLLHGHAKHRTTVPRIAFYVSMYPTRDEQSRESTIEPWRTGRGFPRWRGRPDCDRAEPRPPAKLTNPGRHLLGLDPWPPDSAHRYVDVSQYTGIGKLAG